MRQLTAMLDSSDKVWMHGVMRGRALSTRYKVRATTDPMTTIKHEGDKVQGGNACHYNVMYADHNVIEGLMQVLMRVRGAGNHAPHIH